MCHRHTIIVAEKITLRVVHFLDLRNAYRAGEAFALTEDNPMHRMKRLPAIRPLLLYLELLFFHDAKRNNGGVRAAAVKEDNILSNL